jgi:hypothetical protein
MADSPLPMSKDDVPLDLPAASARSAAYAALAACPSLRAPAHAYTQARPAEGEASPDGSTNHCKITISFADRCKVG